MMKVFVLGHREDDLRHVPKKSFLQPVNLGELALPIENTNDLAENRFFLLDDSYFENCPEYLGVLSTRFNKKYDSLVGLDSLDILMPKLRPQTVFAADPTTYRFPNWISWGHVYHKTFDIYFKDLASFMGLPAVNKPTFWANNFICHKSVFLDFIKVFKKAFEKYGYNFVMQVDDPTRTAAYVYERAAMLYFANRSDLEIKRIPTFLDQIMFFGSSTENYKTLTEMWKNSLLNIGVKKENIKHSTFSLPSGYKKDVAFQTKEYAFCIERKVHYIIEHLKRYKAERIAHRYCAMVDCDIQFFPKKNNSWKDFLAFVETNEGDYYLPYEAHQNDKPVGNSGFVFFKTEKIDVVLRAYEIVHDKIKTAILELNKHGLFKTVPYVDQSIINEFDLGAKLVIIPRNFSMHGADHSHPFKESVLFHHAIGATTVPAKINQMIEAWNIMN
jgi:hypothetical protein